MLLAAAGAAGSAACFVVASTLQYHRAAGAARWALPAGPPGSASAGTSPRIPVTVTFGSELARAVTHPLWLISAGLDVTGVVLQGWALHHGALSLVQPIVVSAGILALPAGAWVTRTRFPLRAYGAALAFLAGLIVFVAAAAPRPGADLPTLSGRALPVLLGLAAGALVLALIGRRGGQRRRATAIGAIAGIAFGLMSALLKICGDDLVHHPLALLASWPGYALVGSAVAGLTLNQLALGAGPMVCSLPAMSLTEPAAASLIGVIAFGERFHLGLHALAVQGLALATLGAGLVLVARWGEQPPTRTGLEAPGEQPAGAVVDQVLAAVITSPVPEPVSPTR